MRRARLLLTLVLLLPFAAFGCDETPTAPTTSQLTGTWRLVSAQPSGEARQQTPPGATYTLTFSDGRLSAHADCNTCNGSYALAGATLSAGPVLACTRAACPTMLFEAIYTTLLAGDSTVTVSGDTLQLESSRGTLRFTR